MATTIQKFNNLRGPIFDTTKGVIRIGNHIELIKKAILRLIFTRKGSRMGNLDFGTTIPDLPFSNDWENLERIISFEISEALALWEPRVAFTGITLIELDQQLVNFKIDFIELITNTEQSLPIVAEFV